jgi:hypothetical protein
MLLSGGTSKSGNWFEPQFNDSVWHQQDSQQSELCDEYFVILKLNPE